MEVLEAANGPQVIGSKGVLFVDVENIYRICTNDISKSRVINSKNYETRIKE